jgi:hypothetical protein
MVGATSPMAESKARRAFLKRNGLMRVGSSLVRDDQPVPSDEIDTLQKDWDAEWERNKDRRIAEASGLGHAHRETYWSLDQAVVWALTRDSALVSWASKPSNFINRVLLASRIGLALTLAEAAGRDVKAELWQASGRPPQFLADVLSAEKIENELIVKLPPFDDSDDAESGTRLALFPIQEYLVDLLRSGTIASLGKPPHEVRFQDLSAADWKALEISERGGVLVAVSQELDLREKCLSVLVSREDVQREFPSAPAPSAPDLKAILSDAIRVDPNLGQREAVKIARDAGAKEPREKILDLLKTLGGSSTRGPKGPRKNCATPPA